MDNVVWKWLGVENKLKYSLKHLDFNIITVYYYHKEKEEVKWRDSHSD